MLGLPDCISARATSTRFQQALFDHLGAHLRSSWLPIFAEGITDSGCCWTSDAGQYLGGADGCSGRNGFNAFRRRPHRHWQPGLQARCLRGAVGENSDLVFSRSRLGSRSLPSSSVHRRRKRLSFDRGTKLSLKALRRAVLTPSLALFKWARRVADQGCAPGRVTVTGYRRQ